MDREPPSNDARDRAALPVAGARHRPAPWVHGRSVKTVGRRAARISGTSATRGSFGLTTPEMAGGLAHDALGDGARGDSVEPFAAVLFHDEKVGLQVIAKSRTHLKEHGVPTATWRLTRAPLTVSFLRYFFLRMARLVALARPRPPPSGPTSLSLPRETPPPGRLFDDVLEVATGLLTLSRARRKTRRHARPGPTRIAARTTKVSWASGAVVGTGPPATCAVFPFRVLTHSSGCSRLSLPCAAIRDVSSSRIVGKVAGVERFYCVD